MVQTSPTAAAFTKPEINIPSGGGNRRLSGGRKLKCLANKRTVGLRQEQRKMQPCMLNSSAWLERLGVIFTKLLLLRSVVDWCLLTLLAVKSSFPEVFLPSIYSLSARLTLCGSVYCKEIIFSLSNLKTK